MLYFALHCRASEALINMRVLFALIFMCSAIWGKKFLIETEDEKVYTVYYIKIIKVNLSAAWLCEENINI